MNDFPNREAAAIKLRELRDREMKVGRGPTPRSEDWDWVDEILEAALSGDGRLYRHPSKSEIGQTGLRWRSGPFIQMWPVKKVCVCIEFSDTAGYRIADLTCPVHGVEGTDPGDWQE